MTTNYADLSADESTSKQPQFGMPYNFYDNQGLYATANKDKLASLALETDRDNLGGGGTSMPIVTVVQNLAHKTRTDHGPAVNRASAGYNMVLPNPLKSPSPIPMLSSAPVAPITGFNETLKINCLDRLGYRNEAY
jgi:hypothetical protein